MKHQSPRILKLAQLGLLGAFTAHAALAANAAPDFDAYDANKDHIVTLEEFTAQGGLEKAFRAGDSNNDGALNQDEFIKAVANNDRAKAGKYIDDAWITTKVKADLMASDGVPGTEISVDTKNGTVWLGGDVKTTAERDRAIAKTKAIKGVKKVDASKLTVAGK